jgi:hypothetical protein
MTKFYFRVAASFFLMIGGLFYAGVSMVRASDVYQQPTVDIPTVTGTPLGPTIRVNADQDQINVRSGPSTYYDIIGVMIAGQTAPALGRTAGGDWVQIGYAGVEGGVAWVYSPLVTLIRSGDLPILEPPPTSTPRVTPTIDPTLAAQFVVEVPSTRLPTFTNAPTLVFPTFEVQDEPISTSSFPMGMLIAFLGIVGIMGALFSFLRGR